MKSIRDLHGKNICVFDMEIKNCIDGETIGWGDHDKMGVSVGVVFDYRDGDTKVFLDDNLPEMMTRLAEADLITGYNIKAFDNVLLAASLYQGLVESAERVKAEESLRKRSFDLLEQVRAKFGAGTRFPKGCKLNDVLEGTFGMKKTEDGADAPLFYQRGEMGKLISYCIADVRRERMAFEYAYLNGQLKTPMHGTHPVPCPVKWMEERKQGEKKQ